MSPRSLFMRFAFPEDVIDNLVGLNLSIPVALEQAKPFFDEAQSVQPYQAAVLYYLAQQYDGGLIVELGTRKGYTAVVMTLAAPAARIFTVDIFATPAQRGLLDYPQVHRMPMFSWDAAEHFSDGSVDMVFVDADHQQVERDWRAWWPKLKAGGLMLFHDYSARFPEVMRVVNLITDKPDIFVTDHMGEGMAGVYQA